MLESFPAGDPHGSWPAEEYAAGCRSRGERVTVVMDTVAQVDERGQEPVDEDQAVPCASADGPLTWPGLQSRLVPFVP
ncbi:hypothetical protein [Streptomyces sp. NPDC092307]|uniref:hypothetical protein n=1 Tax=Streptomyces sp. NPDC092307 TaxID=3366013 RepID=UPI003826C83A